MTLSPLPHADSPDEERRLAALRRYKILDTPPEAAFDRITGLAARLFGVPIVQISLVDRDRQWPKSCFGSPGGSAARELSMCTHAVQSDGVLVVPDAALDERCRNNPLVTCAGGVRFYAGAPLRAPEGWRLGTLCLMDSRPRRFSDAEAATLADLAAVVVDEMELRLASLQLREEAREREQGRRALEASEARARGIIAAAQDAFVAMDGRGAIVDWNRRAEETFGWARSEALGRPMVQTIIPHRFREAHTAGLGKYLQTGQGPVLNQTFEIVALHRDGHEFPVELSIWPVRAVGHESGHESGHEGEAHGGHLFTAFVRDISERKRVEAELESSKRFAESVAEHSTSIIYVFDLRTLSNAYSNRSLAEFLGYTQAQIEAMGRDFLPHVVHPDDLARITGHRSDLQRLPPGQVIEFEARFRHADGSWRWLWNRESVFESDDSGAPVQILGTAQDITERKRAARAIEESEARFSAFMRHVPGVAFIKDRNGRYAFVNETFEDLFGLSHGTSAGLTDAQLWSPEVAAELVANDRRVLDSGRAELVVEAVPQEDGVHFWLAHKFPIMDLDGQMLLAAVAIDITERERAEAELRQSAERLERSNRELERSNRELADFSRVASHDLQEPLRKIRAFGDRLATRHGADLPETGRVYVGFMQQAAARMQVLIEDLLQYSRVTSQAHPFAQTDLGQIARQVLADLELRIEQTGGEVRIGDLPTIEADATQMRQLLQNIIANALKFHRPGAPPVVRLESVTVEGGQACEIVVSDNGIGFEEQHAERIFGPFQRLHAREEYEGTGIGLAICRKIAERHGGGITARSEPGQGAAFRVRLPLSQAGRADQAEPSEETGGAR